VTEVGDIVGDRTGLSELEKFATIGGDEVGIAEVFDELFGEEVEVGHPNRGFLHSEKRSDPSEG
jgi:hypothetical protein